MELTQPQTSNLFFSGGEDQKYLTGVYPLIEVVGRVGL